MFIAAMILASIRAHRRAIQGAAITLALGVTTDARAETPASDTNPTVRVPTLFGGQLVRGTTLAGEASMELGGGGALYIPGTAAYWGGGGGHIFQVGDTMGAESIHLFHGELLIGYDLVQARAVFVSVMALAGVGMTKDERGVFGIAEGRLAVRRPLARWFMVGAHAAYRRAYLSDLERIGDDSLSGPTLGLELYFTH